MEGSGAEWRLRNDVTMCPASTFERFGLKSSKKIAFVVHNINSGQGETNLPFSFLFKTKQNKTKKVKRIMTVWKRISRYPRFFMQSYIKFNFLLMSNRPPSSLLLANISILREESGYYTIIECKRSHLKVPTGVQSPHAVSCPSLRASSFVLYFHGNLGMLTTTVSHQPQTDTHSLKYFAESTLNVILVGEVIKVSLHNSHQRAKTAAAAAGPLSTRPYWSALVSTNRRRV